MFVANAGDSRAVLCQRKQRANAEPAAADELGTYPVPFSFDHTPETERHRLLNVARLKPQLMGKQYAAMEYAKRPHAKDLGQRILCRQGTMKGWTYKTLTRDDLRMPVVTGEGKRSRLLGTLGVTRGFGDHDLLAINTGIQIKPFLTPHPEVKHRDLSKIVSIPGENNEDGDYGILIMATDGLWDVSENDAVSRTVFQTLAKYPTERHRYTMVAQELVARARGKINDSGHWRLADSKAAATVDDISVIVIPVYQYYKEHVEWEQKCAREYRERLAKEAAQQAVEAREDDASSALVNGATNAHVEIENDEDEDEIVVELNRPQALATVEVEEDVEPVQSAIATGGKSAQADTMVAMEQKAEAKDAADPIDTQLNAAAAALEAATISAATEHTETPESSPEKSNKLKQQQQQRNRNRKDKR